MGAKGVNGSMGAKGANECRRCQWVPTWQKARGRKGTKSQGQKGGAERGRGPFRMSCLRRTALKTVRVAASPFLSPPRREITWAAVRGRVHGSAPSTAAARRYAATPIRGSARGPAAPSRQDVPQQSPFEAH